MQDQKPIPKPLPRTVNPGDRIQCGQNEYVVGKACGENSGAHYCVDCQKVMSGFEKEIHEVDNPEHVFAFLCYFHRNLEVY